MPATMARRRVLEHGEPWADVLLAMRELRATRLQIAVEAGLGQPNSRRMQILALDTLVPVTSASSGVRSISIGDLAP
jgi:hypothetical protein